MLVEVGGASVEIAAVPASLLQLKLELKADNRHYDPLDGVGNNRNDRESPLGIPRESRTASCVRTDRASSPRYLQPRMAAWVEPATI